MLQEYANAHGSPEGKPYYSLDGTSPGSSEDWEKMRTTFNCPYGVTNVWERKALRGKERVTIPGGKAVHLNQKPLDLITMLIEASTLKGEVVWEPFGGLFTSMVAALKTGRKGFGGEIDSTYFQFACNRLDEELKSLNK